MPDIQIWIALQLYSFFILGFLRDMQKFGGQGILRQSCVYVSFLYILFSFLWDMGLHFANNDL